ncbi:MAG: PKD domain-containing protein [Planctomycetes bacterium]|nr:PKD domain-containing protein [Planctomycetota bacterium]
MHRSSFLAALALSSTAALAQFNVVIPDGTANAPGNGSNAFPWGTTASAWPGLRLMAVYDALNFTNQSVNMPILINGLKWRPNDTTGAVGGGQFAQAIVELSTSPTGWAAVTTNYATNHGADRAVVYDASVNGPVIHTATPGSGAWTPQSWCVDITLPVPFLYDPSQGDLVIDVDYPGTSFSGSGVGQMDVQNSLASRIFASSMYPTANGTTLNHGPVVEVSYSPAAGLYAAFTSDVTTGPSPLTVNFMDQTFTSDPAGVSSWAWDFENDGTIDSTLQNPTHTYTACGTYDVKLTVTDTMNPTSSVTKTAYITTDLVTADFDDLLIAPLVVQFTDTSAGTPTAWDWDLDGDGLTDSTAQNPAFAYANANPVNVTLTVSRLCGPTDTITKTIIPDQVITTLFAGGNNGGPGWSHLFDISVTNPKGIEIHDLDICSNSAASTPFTLDIYLTSDSYVGKEMTADAWKLVANASGTTVAAATPSPATLSNPIYMPPGDYGILILYNGAQPQYTNGNGTNQFYSNGDLALSLGIAKDTTAGPFGAGTVFDPRVWNGTIYYDTCQFTSSASYGYAGEGCPGSLGVPTLTPSADPVIGTTLSVAVDNLPISAGIMMTGLSNTSSVLGPLPLDTSAFGAPGCFLRVSPDSNLLILGASNTATWNLPIPNSSSLLCVLFFQQAIAIDPGFNPAGAVASDAAGFLIGN